MKKPYIIKEKIDTLDKLRQEKIRLKASCMYQRKLISYQFNYLTDNYPRILSESLLPYDPQKNAEVNSILNTANEIISNILPGIFKTRKLPGLLLKLLEIVVIRAFTYPRGGRKE